MDEAGDIALGEKRRERENRRRFWDREKEEEEERGGKMKRMRERGSSRGEGVMEQLNQKGGAGEVMSGEKAGAGRGLERGC